MSVKPIPDNYPTAMACIIVKGAAAAIDFYKKILGATERMRMTIPGGGPVVHAELQIGDSVLMLADEMPQMGATSPTGADRDEPVQHGEIAGTNDRAGVLETSGF